MRRPRTVVAMILALGVVLAGVAWLTAPPPEDDTDLQEFRHSRRHLRDVERITGKSGVLANDLDDWLASLWEGPTRALTVLAGSAAVAGLYALAARAAARHDD